MVNKFLYPNGGSETYMIKLGSYLESLGHDVQYFGMYDEKNVVGNEYGAYVPNIDFHSADDNVLKKLKIGIETLYSKTACTEIRKVLDAFKPDIVHMNNINFQLTPAIIYEIRKSSIPIVQTIHDVQIACPCHRFYIEHKKQICEQCEGGRYWHCLKNKCLQNSASKSLLATLESYYYHVRNTYNLVDLYICPSKFVAEKIIKAGVAKGHIKVIYNFADRVTNVQPVLKKSKYALYFGRFSKEKGIMSLLDACATMPEVRLIVAGKGPLEDYVEEQANKLPNVDYIGFKTGKELQEIIAGAAFSIYPSEWYENCPLSVIESQTLGTPVIGSDLGGTKELIQHEKTGLIFKGCDTEALKKAIIALWNDDDKIFKMSKQCSNVSQNILEDYAESMLDIYRALIKEKEINKNVK